MSSDQMAMRLDAAMLGGRWDNEMPFRDAVVALMRAVRSGCCWTTNENNQFLVAIAIVQSKAEGEDKVWVESQIDGMKKLNAIMVASAAGLSVNLADFDVDDSAPKRDYALVGLWRETAPPEDAESSP